MSTSATIEQLFSQASALWHQGRVADADASFRTLLAREPMHGEAHHQYGLMLAQHGHGELAREHLAQAEALLPGRVDIKINYATVCQHLGDAATALGLLEAARDLDAPLAELHYNLGVVYQGFERFAEAAVAFARAAELRPDWPEPLLGQSHCLLNTGEPAAARGVLEAACARFPEHRALASNRLLTLNYAPTTSVEELVAAHRAWGEAAVARAVRRTAALPRPRSKRLRVGFVSPNFSEHSVAFFLEPLVAHLSRSRFETVAYSLRATTDEFGARLRTKFDRWRNAERLDDDALETAIVADRIDVLVDLAGHTARSRIELFARRIAPLQLCMIGYPATTGLSTVDYCITDATLDPEHEGDRAYVEGVCRLPLFCCYRPPDLAIDVGALPLTANGAPTFGSFQATAKLSDATLALWGRLFERLPDARLRVKVLGGSDPHTREALLARLGAAGIASARVRIEGFSGLADFLRTHHEIDLCLDTLPWNGHTTTCHALWMGVPTLTLTGDRRAGRMGTALMQAVGLPQYVAATADEFVAAGAAAVASPAALAAIRAGLLDALCASRLCDGKDFAGNFERFVESAYSARKAP